MPAPDEAHKILDKIWDRLQSRREHISTDLARMADVDWARMQTWVWGENLNLRHQFPNSTHRYIRISIMEEK